MRINLRPDSDMSVQKQKIGSVPTLILKPKAIEPAHVGLLWIHGGGYITGMKEMVYMPLICFIRSRNSQSRPVRNCWNRLVPQ